MDPKINQITTQIKSLKQEIASEWQIRGKTDPVILALAEKIDCLLNEYDQLLLNHPQKASKFNFRRGSR